MNDDEKKMVQQEVNKKNTAAVSQTLEEMRLKLAEQQQRIDGLISTMSTFSQRLGELEQLVRVQRAILQGTGPTVR